MKIILNNSEEIFCSEIIFESKELIITTNDNKKRYVDRVDIVSITEESKSIDDDMVMEMVDDFVKNLNVSKTILRATAFGYQEGLYTMIDKLKNQ